MKVPPTQASSSSLNLTGNGEITFDVKQGVPKAIEFTATLTINAGNLSKRLPVTVSCKLIEGAERDQLLKPPTPPPAQGGQQANAQDGAKPAGKPPAAGNPRAAGNPPAAGNPAPAAPPAAKPIVGSAPPVRAAEANLQLPGIGAVAVGGAGRFLILHQPQRRLLNVFDLKEGKIVKTLPTSEVKVLFTAGRTHLIVYLPGAEQTRDAGA